MANADGKCLLSTCSKSGPLQTFKLQAVKKIIESSILRHDDETRNRMQAIFDSQGEQASFELHKNCYCSFTSKDHIKSLVAKKRKEGLIESDDTPVARMRRSQVIDFDLKKTMLVLW